MRLLEEKLQIETITVMVQKEVAERLEIPGGKRNRSNNICNILLYRCKNPDKCAKRKLYTRTRSNLISNSIQNIKRTKNKSGK